MNTRIKELIKEAGFSSTFERDRLHRLVELTVRECADVAKETRWAVPPSQEQIARGIQQHFGVEESKGWVCSKCGIDRTKDVCPKGHMAAVTGECPMVAEAQ